MDTEIAIGVVVCHTHVCCLFLQANDGRNDGSTHDCNAEYQFYSETYYHYSYVFRDQLLML